MDKQKQVHTLTERKGKYLCPLSTLLASHSWFRITLYLSHMNISPQVSSFILFSLQHVMIQQVYVYH